MLTFFHILFLCFCGITFFRYYKTTLRLRKQIIRLTRQNNRLSDKMSKNLNIKIKYIDTESKYGIIKSSCNLYIAPIYNSPIINQLRKDTRLEIVDSAFIDDERWYEISIWNSIKTNNKGWVNEEFISITSQKVVELNKKETRVNS